MNTFLKIFVICTIVIVFILSAITVYQYINDQNSTPSVPGPQTSGGRDDSVQQAITATTDADQAVVSGAVTIPVSAFQNNGRTFEDPMNAGNYILAGDLKYCLENNTCSNNQDQQNFSVWFDGTDGIFYVELLEQPIAGARRDAEAFLVEVLQISPRELCELGYYMSVLERVDSQFSGQHLQFSLCPGAQRL